jgi:FdhD protein
MVRASTVTSKRDVWRLSNGALAAEGATVIVEEPLQILVDGAPYSVLMRTPGDDTALAAGFCLAEGLIESRAEIGSIQSCAAEDRNQVAVTRTGARASEGPPTRPMQHAIASSCGLCGRELIEDIAKNLPPSAGEYLTSAQDLLVLGRRLQDEQRYFRPTGGTHAAGLFDASGELLSAAEDVGRHNALDKAIGRLLLEDRLGEAKVAVLSGRCSFEMVQKAARAGIPVVAAVSAPTALAIELAERSGLALVGFLRDTTLTVYVAAGRIEDLR